MEYVIRLKKQLPIFSSQRTQWQCNHIHSNQLVEKGQQYLSVNFCMTYDQDKILKKRTPTKVPIRSCQNEDFLDVTSTLLPVSLQGIINPHKSVSLTPFVSLLEFNLQSRITSCSLLKN